MRSIFPIILLLLAATMCSYAGIKSKKCHDEGGVMVRVINPAHLFGVCIKAIEEIDL